MITNLVISGGPLHDFAASSQSLVTALAEVGVRSTIFVDPHAAFAELLARPSEWDLVTVNALAWSMNSERYRDLREQWAFELRDEQARALHDFVHSGGGLLACHTAVICFDGHPLWVECVGASWAWGRSSHPPLGRAAIAATPAGQQHEITAGVAEFMIDDEIYESLDQSPDLVPLLASRREGVDHPVLWARSVGRGRVVTDLLGHNAAAVSHAAHRQVVQHSAQWLTHARKEGRARV